MVIDSTNAQRFITHYRDFLLSIAKPEVIRGRADLQVLALARKRYQADRGLFSAWRAKNNRGDADVLDAIANIDIRPWIYLKDTRSYSVFLRESREAAYAVYGLTDRLRSIVGYSGVFFTCGVFQLDGKFVCDAILEGTVILGGNYMASFHEAYQSLRQSGHFYRAPSTG